MGKIKHKNGQVGSGVALNMIKANSNAPFELGGQKGVGKNHMEGPLLQRGKRLKSKIEKLSDKHSGLYGAVVEGHGQNKYTSGDYDADRKKLYKVENRLEKAEKKYQEKFGKSPYASEISEDFKEATNKWVKNSLPRATEMGQKILSMQTGPLNKQKRFDKTVSKAEEALEKGNYRKAFRKSKSAARQAGLGNAEVNFKTWKSDQGLSMKGPLNKGCAKSDGGPGCVQKRGDEYVIINNKKPGNQIWRSGFPSRKAANDNLAGYHASK